MEVLVEPERLGLGGKRSGGAIFEPIHENGGAGDGTLALEEEADRARGKLRHEGQVEVGHCCCSSPSF
jgi:hypothetical protein